MVNPLGQSKSFLIRIAFLNRVLVDLRLIPVGLIKLLDRYVVELVHNVLPPLLLLRELLLLIEVGLA